MAEFQEAMKQWRRMCKMFSCEKCPLNEICASDPESRTDVEIARIEEAVTSWADGNRELVYSDIAERTQSRMEGLTKIGFDQIIERIQNMRLSITNPATLKDLERYLEGYKRCKSDIISLLQELRDQCGRYKQDG